MKRLLILLFALLPALAHADPLYTRYVQATPTIDTAIYASGDTVGTLMTFSAVCNAATNRGQVLGVKIFDKAKQAVDLDLVLFNATPAGTFTDQAAFDPTDAGMLDISAVILVSTHKAFSDNGVSQAAGILYPVECTSTRNILGYLVSRGTPTYASASDLTVQIEVLSD